MLRLVATTSAPRRVAFGLPLPPRRVHRVDEVAVYLGGRRVPARVTPLLRDYAAGPIEIGVRAVLIELDPATRLPSIVDVRFSDRPDGTPISAPQEPSRTSFAATAHPVEVAVDTAEYDVERRSGSGFAAVPTNRKRVVLFETVEAPVRALFPPGYLAATQILGDVMPRHDVLHQPELAGMRFLSDAMMRFADSGMGTVGYAVHPASVSPQAEAWLYDRCASYLLAYAHGGEARHLSYGLHTCARYARDIGLVGERRGLFAGKREPDAKYSHLRGLVAYYALTGDDAALEAGRAIAEMWERDPLFSGPYRGGSARGADKLWTERLLAASLQGGVYGFWLTGEPRFLDSAKQLMATALRHITTEDPVELTAIGLNPFPPQSCFVHNALQQAEGRADQPWCSSWMSELVIDPMLRFQELTGDARVDEIFIRLARSMRDFGAMYVQDGPLGDSFLSPSRRVEPGVPRMLTPMYGYGIDAAGKRVIHAHADDYDHCPDALAITAVALRALVRQGRVNDPPVPAAPTVKVDLSRFATEMQSFEALHHEFAACAAHVFQRWTRVKRDPNQVPQDVLAKAYAASPGPERARRLEDHKVGWPVYDASPGRRLSWWFNTSIASFAWLMETGLSFAKIQPGIAP